MNALSKLSVLGVALLPFVSSFCMAKVLDAIEFGDEQSGVAHGLEATNSQVISGRQGLPAQQLLPPSTAGWRGGRLSFRMAVNPEGQNYFTAIFWGGDHTGEHSRLMLFIDGKQVGQRHLGEVDQLDTMYEYPRYPGGFLYKTLPLPMNMTRGKGRVELAIEAQGPIWGYGDTAERFQRNMTKPSRGIYGGFVHDHPCFEIPAGDATGHVEETFPVRPTPGPEAFDKVRERLNGEVDKLLRSKGTMSHDAIRFFARACLEPWCDAYHSKPVLERIVEAIDEHYRIFEADPQSVEKEWHGYGPLADGVRVLEGPLRGFLNEEIEGTEVTRREGWAEMFMASRDRKVTQRRAYTNQSMIVDMNIYRCNRAVKALSPMAAWPEDKALRLLHESAGVEPWSGSWDADLTPSWKLGKEHMLFTAQGLTKELGYVGHYGEIVIGMMLEAYDSTRPSPDRPGDPRLKAQLIKMARARGVFRYPLPDADGYRSMHIETVIGWRDWYYPGGTTYEQMATEAPMDVAAATLDPVLVGYSQQMIEENQFFASIGKRVKLRGWSPMTRLLGAQRSYEKIKAQPPQKNRLPMAWDQPDFVFADPEIGVVALKNGREILYVSLYWRARYAINNLARVHYLTPSTERDATVKIETRFKDSGLFFTLPDQTNEPFSRRHEGFYQSQGMTLAVAGEKQPIAKVPADQLDYSPGKENPYAGKGDFYLMHYGPYVIAMNCTRDEVFQFSVPEEFRGVRDLVSGKTSQSSSIAIRPWQTVVLYRKP
ncbi:hypothetical protein [Haloferula rosea]|uniref:Uncharacterized protein n=1 Tax=Haloferula rosea TaxID=490093 RepID=A0A934RGF2_9BACT|nr:hypothetical protein [Haloferula rosea]MBK1828699.1 hypothetical protein [Haloferula rosea]